MKTLTKIFASAGLATAALSAMPALAQAEGKVATASIDGALLGVPGLTTALEQVGTTYSAQLQQVQTKQTQLSELLKPYDTNGDGQIGQQETAGLQAGANFGQIQALRNEIAGVENQITAAQIYAVEQVLIQYQTALAEVATQQQIVMVVDPAGLQYAAPSLDITQAVSTALAAKVPTVGIVPPAGWQPSQNSVQVFQDIQRRILIGRARAQQQQQQQQQGNEQAPVGR